MEDQTRGRSQEEEKRAAKSGRRRAFGEENGRIWHNSAIQRPVFVFFGTSLAEQRVESSSFKLATR
jgi:hypothetical protein